MEKKSPAQITVLVAGFVLLLAAVAASIYVISMDESSLIVKICAGVTTVALLSAFAYLAMGATKNQASFYKLILLAFSLSEFGIVGLSSTAGVEVNLLNALCYGLVLILAVRENLGRTLSEIFCGAVVTLRIVAVVLSFKATSDLHSFHAAAELVLAIVLLVCVVGKYRDKALRGTV